MRFLRVYVHENGGSMPLEALSAKARLMVPVGAIDEQVRVADAVLADLLLDARGQARGEVAAREIEILVEHRERAALLRELDRGEVGAVAHELGDLRGHVARVCGVVAQAQHASASPRPVKPRPTRRLAIASRAALERPRRHVEHVVEHAHATATTSPNASKSNARGPRNGRFTKRVRSIDPRQQQP
jgi:hypothetical protein